MDFDKIRRRHPSTEEKADALIEQIGAQIEQRLDLGERAGDAARSNAAGRRKNSRLKFGKNYKPEQNDSTNKQTAKTETRPSSPTPFRELPVGARQRRRRKGIP